MATETPTDPTEPTAETPVAPDSAEAPESTEAADSADVSESGPNEDEVNASTPEFAEVDERVVSRLDTNSERLHGVSVPVWAELGRVEMLIGDLLQLGEGSVVRLDRSVGDPVDLVSQGVKLARGEVIVVDNCFAIRIREILSGE